MQRQEVEGHQALAEQDITARTGVQLAQVVVATVDIAVVVVVVVVALVVAQVTACQMESVRVGDK